MCKHTEALLVAITAHGDQKRKYNATPYAVHPIRVSQLIRQHTDADLESDESVAAVLHDVLEDTDYSAADMRAQFGDTVTDLVLEVTNVAQPEDGNRAQRKALNVAHLAKASYAGKTIKLADIIDNVSKIVEEDPKFAKTYLAEKVEALKVLGDGNPRLYAIAGHMIEEGQRKLAA